MDFKKMTPRVTASSHKFLKHNFRTANAGAEYILEACTSALYPRTMHNIKGKFTADELRLILDVFNATALTAGSAGQHLVMNAVDGMELDGLDKKWNVDRKIFTLKLQSLSIFEAACLEIWAVGFWYGEDPDKNLDINQRVAPLISESEQVKIFCQEASFKEISHTDINHYIETIQSGRRMSGSDEKTGEFLAKKTPSGTP